MPGKHLSEAACSSFMGAVVLQEFVQMSSNNLNDTLRLASIW